MIPKEIRDRLGIGPGDEVVFIPEENGVRIEPAGDLAALGGAFGAYELTEELEAEHRRELADEPAPGQ